MLALLYLTSRPPRKYFLTSLYKLTYWNCYRAWKEQEKGRVSPLIDDLPAPITAHLTQLAHIHDCMELLEIEERDILTQYYVYNRTMAEIGKMNGYSRECARVRLIAARERLREICLTT